MPAARRERLLPPDRATRSCSRPGSCSRRSSMPTPTTRSTTAGSARSSGTRSRTASTTQGSQFDTDGALRNWWTDEDRAEFERRADVIVEQFNALPDRRRRHGQRAPHAGREHRGPRRHHHRARRDARGGRHADAPLVDGLTPDQRFFLAYATMWRMGYTEAASRMLANVDRHSPSQYRVNGPLSNTPAFAAAFAVAGRRPDGAARRPAREGLVARTAGARRGPVPVARRGQAVSGRPSATRSSPV